MRTDKPPTAANARDSLLTTAEAAEYLGLGKRTLEDWRIRPSRGRTGEMDFEPPAFVRVGRRNVRYRRSDLDAWLAERTARTTTAEQHRDAR